MEKEGNQVSISSALLPVMQLAGNLLHEYCFDTNPNQRIEWNTQQIANGDYKRPLTPSFPSSSASFLFCTFSFLYSRQLTQFATSVGSLS